MKCLLVTTCHIVLLLFCKTEAFLPTRCDSRSELTRCSVFANDDTEGTLHNQTQPTKRHKPPTTKYVYIACSSTQELTRAIQLHVTKSDVVAELGAQLRNVTQAICDSSNRVVLVDIVRKTPHQTATKSRAMRIPGKESQLPSHVTFVEIASLQDWRKALFCTDTSTPSYSVFVLDVNAICGNDLEVTSLSIIQEFVALNDLSSRSNGDSSSCRLLVLVKSASLHKWASQLMHVRKWKESAATNNSVASRIPFPHVIACVGVDEYRSTIPFAVQPGDAVLEVGCHLGTTAALVHKQASGNGGYCIGVDVGGSIVNKAKKRHPGVYFAVGDAWKTADLLRIQQGYLEKTATTKKQRRIGFDVIYVDVGGLSGSDGLLEALMLLSSLSNALEPRYIIIKSQCVQRLATTLIPYWQAQKWN